MAGKIPAATVVDPASRPAPPRSQTQQAIGPPTADNLAPGGTVNRKKQKRRQKLAARQQQTDVEQDSVNYNLASGYALPSSANNLTHSNRQNGNGPAEDDEYEYDDEAGGSVYRGVAPTTHGSAHRRELVEQDDDIASSTYDASAQSRKKSKRKKSQTQQEQQYAEQQLRKQQQQQERHLLGTAASRAVSMMPPSRAQLAPSDDALRTVSRRISKDNIWDSSTDEERLRIRGFWYSLEEADRKSLVRIEKEAVLGKMKEQQKHSCSCTVCGRKRTAIEEELEILYDAYYDELEQYANNKQLDPVQGHAPLPADHPRNRRIIRDKATLDLEEDRERVSEADSELNDEDELDDDDDQEYSEEYSELTDDAYPDSAADFFTFGNSLTVQGGILTVADDLLKNDGSKFIEMMEQLAARRLAREHEATGQNKWQYAHAALDPQREHASHANHIHPDDPDEYDDDMEEDYDDDSQVDYDEAEDEMDQMNEHQRMEEGRRMFQIFAARMFEQRVVTAYREKAAKEKADRLIQELAEEENASTQQNAKKAREAEKKRIKKQQQKQAKAEEKARKEQEKAAAEAAIKEAEAKRQEELRLKREEQRKKKKAERKALEEEKGRKEAEKQKRLDAEREKQQEAERKAREIKAEEKRRKDEAKRKEREEREAREAAEQAARDKKAAEERKNREEERERREEERERRDREDKAKADARAAARAEARVRDRKYREEQEAIVVAHNEKWERAFAKLQAQSAEEVPRLTYETTAYGKMVSELPAEIEALRSPTPPSATTLASPAANIKTFLKPTVRPSQSKTEAASHGIPYRTPHLTPSPLLVEPISQPVKQPSPAKSLSSQQSSLGGSHNNITASQTMNQSRSFVSPPAAASSLHAIPPPPGISIQPNASGLGGQMGLGGMNSFPIQHNGVMHGMNPRAPFPQHANTFPQQSHHPMPPQRQPFNSGLQHPQQYGQQHGQQHGPQQPQQQSQRGHQYQKQYPLGQPPPGYMDLRTLPPHSFSMAPMSHRKTRPDQERGVGMTAYGGIDMPDWNTLSQRQAAAATPREAVHGRQQSASFEGNAAFSEAPGAATRPIGKPAGPIKPPSISKAHEDHKSRDSDVEDLAHHLGSAALLAESEKEEDGGTPFLPAPRRTAGAPSLMSIGANQFNNRNVPPFGAPSRPVASDIWARAASRMGNFGVRGRNLDTMPPYFREYHGLAMHLQPGQPLSPIYPQGWAAVQHHPPADVPRHHGTPMAALSLSPNGPLPTRTEVVRGLLKLTCQGLEERNPADGFCDLAEAMSVTQDTARLSQGAYTIPTVEEIRIVAEIPGNVDNGEGYFTLRDHPQHGPGIRWDPYNGSTLPINGMRNPANLPHNNGGSLISREIEYSMVNAAAASAAGMAHAAVGEPGDGSGLGSGPRRGF